VSFALGQPPGAGLIGDNGYQGARRVIDLSGDGRANSGLATRPVRAAVLGAGITINALAIMNEGSDLADYYGTRVIGGPGAFLTTAADYADFARAMTRKLVTEITGAPLAEAAGAIEIWHEPPAGRHSPVCSS
jgi:hypothetical protein